VKIKRTDDGAYIVAPIDGRTLKFKLFPFGLVIEEIDSGNPNVSHRNTSISFHDLAAKAEKQLPLV
jgi:hypothetical protein